MANVDTEPKWYILHTYSGYEAMVKESLLRLIENNNLQDSIVDVKIPTEQTIEEKANGKKKVVERKLLPCYVFIKMIYSNQIWYLVTNTRGVTGFCGPQGRPIPMKEEEIRRLRLEEYVADADFEVGDRVAIDNGPLEGFVGTIREINPETQRAKVSIVMFGRQQDVEVEYVQMQKVPEGAERPNNRNRKILPLAKAFRICGRDGKSSFLPPCMYHKRRK